MYCNRLASDSTPLSSKVLSGMKEAQEKLTGDAFRKQHVGDELWATRSNADVQEGTTRHTTTSYSHHHNHFSQQPWQNFGYSITIHPWTLWSVYLFHPFAHQMNQSDNASAAVHCILRTKFDITLSLRWYHQVLYSLFFMFYLAMSWNAIYWGVSSPIRVLHRESETCTWSNTPSLYSLCLSMSYNVPQFSFLKGLGYFIFMVQFCTKTQLHICLWASRSRNVFIPAKLMDL